MASTCAASFTGHTQKNSEPRLFSGTRKLCRASSQRVTVSASGFAGERGHHVIVEGHAADRQVAVALGGQIDASAPGRVGIAQDDAGAVASGHALHPGEDGIEHRFEATGLQQQPIHLAQGLQVGMLLTDPLRAAIEGLDQALHVVAADRRHLGESGGGQILKAIAQGHQARLVATHQVGDRSAGAQYGGQQRPEPGAQQRVPDGDHDHQTGTRVHRPMVRTKRLTIPLFNRSAIHP